MPTESDLLPDLPHPPSAVPLGERLAGWAETLDLSLSRLALGAAVTITLGIAGWRLLAPSGAPPEMELPMVTSGTEETAAAAAIGTSPTELTGTVTPGAESVPSPSRSTGGDEVVVHVAGAVHSAGVQRMSPSARVVDAVDAAGGATEDADLARVNLAAELQDGQQIYVPAIGEASAAPSSAASGLPAGEESVVVNINTAGLSELESLPGIGPAIGQAIVDHRERQGPFSTVDQLTDVRGIGEAKLEGLRDRATV